MKKQDIFIYTTFIFLSAIFSIAIYVYKQSDISSFLYSNTIIFLVKIFLVYVIIFTVLASKIHDIKIKNENKNMNPVIKEMKRCFLELHIIFLFCVLSVALNNNFIDFIYWIIFRDFILILSLTIYLYRIYDIIQGFFIILENKI